MSRSRSHRVAARSPRASSRSAAATLTHRLRNYLLAGIIVSAPITITLFIVWQVLSYVDQTVTPFIPAAYNPENLPAVRPARHRPRRHSRPADPDRLARRRASSAAP